jgi:polar amino acid transport system substrate-binding protein
VPSRREFVSGVCAVGLGAALPLAAWAQAPESTLARVKRTGQLRTGVIAGAAPYFAKSVASGEWQGFGVDFARQLAQALGVKLELVPTTWGNAVLDLQSNKIDLMFGLGPTEQRRKMIGFSDPIFHNTFTLVARRGYDPHSWAEADRAGIKIGVDIGSNQDAFATQTFKNATVQRFDTSGDATLALQTGRVDAQLLVALLGVTVLSKAPGLGHMVVPTPVEGAPVCAGFQQESDTAFAAYVNGWIAQARSSGQVKRTILDNMQQLVGIDPQRFPSEVAL